MRDTLQSFNSSKMSPTSILKSRRFREGNDAGHSTFYSQYSRQHWDERQQRNSEVRLSHKSELMTLQHQQSEVSKMPVSLGSTLGSGGLTLADRVR